jgi:hypothetical protein
LVWVGSNCTLRSTIFWSIHGSNPMDPHPFVIPVISQDAGTQHTNARSNQAAAVRAVPLRCLPICIPATTSAAAAARLLKLHNRILSGQASFISLRHWSLLPVHSGVPLWMMLAVLWTVPLPRIRFISGQLLPCCTWLLFPADREILPCGLNHHYCSC